MFHCEYISESTLREIPCSSSITAQLQSVPGYLKGNWRQVWVRWKGMVANVMQAVILWWVHRHSGQLFSHGFVLNFATLFLHIDPIKITYSPSFGSDINMKEKHLLIYSFIFKCSAYVLWGWANTSNEVFSFTAISVSCATV